ncbi:nuclear transport factor 2 family protein [Prochlorococcus marinus XMU1406]|uniref:nuclear transport factor 2 family protein n=1 Tax=Prochlorococcus marinus TaxID=1219 RepID=UPI001ADC9810|nr:nuclear transport factor 2 family protein [Prochlorococcus marinus]MBO8207229.1 nuclear transport factor 2 family protein [Prochlorococcus marinus XMU1406]MCR8543044.1 nuclear transport factor 2 family protein [Prochlorococcus marinus XMU1427]
MSKVISVKDLKELFTKSYGQDAPSKQKWAEFYNDDVIFIDPTQEKKGLNSYIEAQENLVKRCDDVYLETHAISITGKYGFVEWTMGLKIKGIEFIYPGITRLIFSKNGLIKEHRDYFDFCGPTFGPVPILGPFIRWLYSRFVS